MRNSAAGTIATNILGWLLFVAALFRAGPACGQATEPDWAAIGAQAARLLAEYVRIDTQNPPGRTVEAVDFLDQHLRQAGLPTERVAINPEKPILIGRLKGTGGSAKPIILLNHMDVVPADPAQWSLPPLSGQVRNGQLYGRGAIDMKGFAIVQLLALALLAQRGERPQHDLMFLAVPDEEVGGTQGVAWLMRNRSDLTDAAAVWDEGGAGLSDAFAAPVFLVSVTEKKVLWVRLVAEGPSGHGSRPLANGAPTRLQRALERVLASPRPPRLTTTMAETLARVGTIVGGVRGFALRHIDNPVVWRLARRGLGEDPLAGPSIHDTVTLTMLQAGYKPNVIPERAEAVLDCRLLPDTDQDVFLTDLKRTIGDDGIRIEIIQPAEPAPSSPTSNDLFRAIAQSVATVVPGAVLAPFMSLNGTDSRFFRSRGIPAYGLLPVLLPKDLYATMHGVDERLPVDSLAPAVHIVYEALRRL